MEASHRQVRITERSNQPLCSNFGRRKVPFKRLCLGIANLETLSVKTFSREFQH